MKQESKEGDKWKWRFEMRNKKIESKEREESKNQKNITLLKHEIS